MRTARHLKTDILIHVVHKGEVSKVRNRSRITGDGDTFLNLNQRREKMDTHNMEERLHWYRW